MSRTAADWLHEQHVAQRSAEPRPEYAPGSLRAAYEARLALFRRAGVDPSKPMTLATARELAAGLERAEAAEREGGRL